MTEALKIGLVQMRCGADFDANLTKAREGIREASARGARIVCLQELFRTPYFCQEEDFERFDLAESIPGPTTEALGKVCRQCDVEVVASLFERRAPGLHHNTSVLLDASGQIAGLYRKMHIPDDPGYCEKFYFTPGDLGFRTHRRPYAQVGMLVCWDQWFPEAARLTALGGSQVLFYPTAIGWIEGESEDVDRGQYDAWETVQRGHAVANGVFVAAVNRVGREGGLRFWGQSFVCDPFGQILAKASSDQEEVLVVDCDLSAIDRTRRHWPFLRDRRIDAYAGLSRRFLDREDG